jgi:Tfp pilus assembly protein PilO
VTAWLSTIDPKRVPLFAMATVALVAAAMALYIVVPQAKARRAVLQEKASLVAAGAVATGLAAERAALESAVRELVARAAEHERSTPQLAASMIEKLQELATHHGVDLVAVEPNMGSEIATLQETVLDVELVGEYDDIVEYLRGVRTKVEPLVIRELSLQPLDEAAHPKIHAVLVAAAFGEAQ